MTPTTSKAIRPCAKGDSTTDKGAESTAWGIGGQAGRGGTSLEDTPLLLSIPAPEPESPLEVPSWLCPLELEPLLEPLPLVVSAYGCRVSF